MSIDGKTLANDILTDLTSKVTKLKENGVIPTLAVILIGNNPASVAYIKQKQKTAQHIGARIVMSNTMTDLSRFNSDPAIHGVIVQRPVPYEIGEYHVALPKDVDGFENHSPFAVPVALAVWHIIKSTGEKPTTFAVIGRGETAGSPIAHYLKKQGCATSVIHAKTPHPETILKRTDCIISCVGKARVITRESVKPGAILIGVGIWRGKDGKLKGDYEENEIADVASFYTPTPGGVGPVNVACLMQNLVKACMINI